jgi:NAD(P)-dependent dehydrogenase (short-subunit alcohol dehydrogenase family)
VGARGLRVAVTGAGGRALAEAFRAEGASVAAGDVGAAMARLGGGLDCLVDVAEAVDGGPVEDLSPASWDRIVAAAVAGPLRRVRVAMPALKEAGGSVALVAPAGGPPGLGRALAKYGAVALTETLARELRPYGVRVNTVLPGDRGETTAADLARAVLHLASPLGAHISGQHLGVRVEQRSGERGRS